MAKGSACFNCKHSINPRVDVPGWAYDCKFGIDNSKMNGDVEQVIECQKGDPMFGFQIGGYYSHMWFYRRENSDCLEWVICSDGEFPTEKDSNEGKEFHICDFQQIEDFVKFWKKELERRGWL